MLSFSDVKRYINDSPSITKFKTWWDISLDLLLIGLFLLMLLAWARSYSVEVGGMVCVPLNGDAFGFASSDARYIQSRCYMESSIRNIEFYPYIIFLQWIIVFLCQISWVWIPAIVEKFKYFHSIFQEITTIEPAFVFNDIKHGFLPKLDYSSQNKEKLKVLHDRITFMLMDKNYLSKIYLRKFYVLSFLIFTFLVLTIAWVCIVNFLQADFSCKLSKGKSRKEFALVTCNISPQLFLYGVMVLHLLILLLMMIFSIRGLVWHIKASSRLKNGGDNFFGDFEDNYKGLPGYEDLALILELLSTNMRDGKLTLTIIMYVLNAQYNQQTQHLAIDNKKLASSHESFSFFENWVIVNIMLSEMGLKISSFEQYPNKLFEILTNISKTSENVTLFVGKTFKDRLLEEITNDHIYSVPLIKNSLISTSQDNICANDKYTKKDKDDIFRWLDSLNEKKAWPNHIILQAAANLLKVQFVIISAYSPKENDIFYADLIKPTTKVGIFKTILIAFLYPHYYYNVENIHNITITQSTNQSDFILRRKYRERLRTVSVRKFITVKDNANEPPVFSDQFHLSFNSLEKSRATTETGDNINSFQNDTIISIGKQYYTESFRSPIFSNTTAQQEAKESYPRIRKEKA